MLFLNNLLRFREPQPPREPQPLKRWLRLSKSTLCALFFCATNFALSYTSATTKDSAFGKSSHRGNVGETTLSSQTEDSTRNTPRLPKTPEHKKKNSSQHSSSAKTYNAERVVVTGARNEVLLKNSPVRVEIIDKEVTKTTGMVNLGNMLQEQTGMNITYNVRSGVQIMGLNPDYTMILIDGQPMIGRVAGVLDLTRISVGNIERIEVVKGPMSSLYGSEALAGVINIITRKPETGLSLRAYGQVIERGATEAQAEFMFGGESFDLAVFGNYKHSTPFSRTQTIESDTLTVPFSGFSDRTAQARVKWYPLPNLNVSANLRLFGTQSDGVFIESFFGQVAANKGSVEQVDASATVGVEWTLGKARLSAQTYYSAYDETYNFDVAQGQAGRRDNLVRRISRTLAQYDALWNERNRFTLGGELQFDDASGSRYQTNPSYQTAVAFGQWEGNPLDWLSYAVSARFDANNAFGNSFNPRLSLLFKPSDALQIRASGGTGFKAPDFRQLFVEFSNRLAGAGYDLIGAYRLGNTLEPEQALAFDFGVVWNIGELAGGVLGDHSLGVWDVEARIFHNSLTNLIEVYRVGRTDNRDVYSYRNVSQAFTQGLEINLRSQAQLSFAETLTTNFGYQYLSAMDAEVLEAIAQGLAGSANPTTGDFERLSRSAYRGLWFRPPHSGVVRVQYDNLLAGFSANIRAQYIGEMGDEALDQNGFVIGNPPRKVWDRPQESIPAYWNLNAAVSKTFAFEANNKPLGVAAVRLTAGVNNMLDAINLRSLPNLVGRQFFVNLNIEW
jgi:outer membrane receptor for ferrienterochelin and colicins